LQERELRPLGAARSEKVDVRVLSATNRDLAQRMREGAFREDLFYRLNVIEVVLPPLRDRAEDVLPLAEHFLTEAAGRSAKRIMAFTQAALKILLAYPWPGNVRELENVVERAVALAEADQIGPDDLPSQVRERRSSDVLAGALARNLTLSDLEREYINRVLQAEGGNKTRAAQRLGLGSCPREQGVPGFVNGHARLLGRAQPTFPRIAEHDLVEGDDEILPRDLRPGETLGLHGLERFGGVPLPIRDLARRSDCRERYDFVGLPGYFLSVRLGSSIIEPVGSTM
jgi:hypothetical protein